MLWLGVRRCRGFFSGREALGGGGGGVDVVVAAVIAIGCALWRPSMLLLLVLLLLLLPSLDSRNFPDATRKLLSFHRLSFQLIFTITAGFYFFNALRG